MYVELLEEGLSTLLWVATPSGQLRIAERVGDRGASLVEKGRP
jgi:hypothetical protein